MRIVPLDITNKTQFDDFYAIYCVSFPLSEQKPYEELLRMGSSSFYTIFTAQHDEKTLGFCIMFHKQTLDFYLLEYMAVDTQQRSLGVGSHLFTCACEYLVKTYGLKPFLIEIDSPEKPSNEQDIREKREQFYRKLGCKKVDPFDYILPLNTQEIPPPMELLVYHPSLSFISKQHLSLWLEALYTHVYGCDKNDVRLATMLEHAPPTLNLI